MKILNELEIETFESPPALGNVERQKFLTLPPRLQEVCDSLRTPTGRVCFTLMTGYFRARNKFFGKRFNPADLDFVAEKMGINRRAIKLKTYDKRTSARHQQIILEFFGCRKFDQEARLLVSRKIADLVRLHQRPKLIFLEAIQFLAHHKTALPGYTTLAGLITGGTNRHKRHLIGIVETHLSDSQRQKLDSLVERDAEPDGRSGPSAGQAYRLTLLKKFRQSTKPARIKLNVADWRLLHGLYREMGGVILALGLTHDGLAYFANSVIKAEIFQVTRRSASDCYLHLLTFIAHQSFKLQDTLVETLLHCVQTTLNTALREHKEQYYNERLARREMIDQLIKNLDRNVLSVFSEMQGIITDGRLNSEEKLAVIAGLIETHEPEHSRLADQVRALRQAEAVGEHDRSYYLLLGRKSLKLQNRVAEIVRHVEFNADPAAADLFEAVRHYQEKRGEIDREAPMQFLAPAERKVVVDEQGKFYVSLYKALLFIEIAKAVKAGTLNLKHSYKYRSLEDYLLPKETWKKSRDELLDRAGLRPFADYHKTIEELRRELDDQYHHTNRRIQQELNPWIKFRANRSFFVKTPKAEEEKAAPLRNFFPERKYISLLEVLSTVNKATRFLGEFMHWQHKYQRHKPADKTFFAGIIGYGCDIGEQKIAQISKQINESELENAINWFFTVPALHAANDRILSVLDKLELPNLYRRRPGRLHTSSDGQKVEVTVESFNANYSFKYFGQSKGASVCSFIDERHFSYYSDVISSAEREAAYVIDGLMHNDVVKSDIHSTDTHGYSELIFATTFLLGFTFAPRIQNIGRRQIYAFEKRKRYEERGYQALPDAYIDTELIEAHWDDILRFVATIKLKHTTASQLFKRLNSYSRQHPLYQALKEFGKISKSIFILTYIDDPVLRQEIEKQLNKGENANKFSRAISQAHAQEFTQGEKEEQQLVEGCRRLIKNAIICWNYLYLSQQLLEAGTREQKAELIAAIKNGSVVSWRHINLHGEYDFSDEKLQDSVGLDLTKIINLKLD
jgi:TnpA family transposase